MATPTQQSSLIAVSPMPVMKQILQCSTMGYLLLINIPKHKVLIISGDVNSLIGKNENNDFGLDKLAKRNGKYLAAFSLKNSL